MRTGIGDEPLLTHSDILSTTMTCWACPEQWEGKLRTGWAYYFRYRSGWASLAIGPNARAVGGVIRQGDPAAGPDVHVAGARVGDRLSGSFDTDERRSEVFAELLAAAYDLAGEPSTEERECPGQ